MDQLPEEAVLLIALELDARDVVMLSATCKQFLGLRCDNYLWGALVKKKWPRSPAVRMLSEEAQWVDEYFYRLFRYDPEISRGSLSVKKFRKALVEDGAVASDSSEDVFDFLVSTNCSKKIIGELLCATDDDFARKFFEVFDCSGMTVLQSLRALLAMFRLPGEASKIDRIIARFATRFFECNGETLHNLTADAVYVLVFAIIMLNTDLYNPMITNKMTKDVFVRNLTGCGADSGDMDRAFLMEIYDELAAESIPLMPREEAVYRGTVKVAKQGMFRQSKARVLHVSAYSVSLFADDSDAFDDRILWFPVGCPLSVELVPGKEGTSLRLRGLCDVSARSISVTGKIGPSRPTPVDEIIVTPPPDRLLECWLALNRFVLLKWQVYPTYPEI